MRHSSSNRRSRNRGGNNGRRGGNNKTKVFDSNGPDVRIRGTAYQVSEKYLALAKDASGAGDAILAESYLQHAEHYQRFISGWVDAMDEYTRTGKFPENYNDQPQEKTEKQAVKPQKQTEKVESDDLGLPESIVGEPVAELESA